MNKILEVENLRWRGVQIFFFPFLLKMQKDTAKKLRDLLKFGLINTR